MIYSKKRLEDLIKSGLYVDIPPEIIYNSFPHYERPTANEMEFAIDRLIRDKTVPKEVMVKIETKPTAEMLKAFCEERGLSCEFDHINLTYRFRLKEFKNNKAVLNTVRTLLVRIQDEKGTSFWKRQPSTDLEEAAQALAKLVPPE